MGEESFKVNMTRDVEAKPKEQAAPGERSLGDFTEMNERGASLSDKENEETDLVGQSEGTVQTARERPMNLRLRRKPLGAGKPDEE